MKSTKKTKIYYLGPKYSFHYFALLEFIESYSHLYFDIVVPKPSDNFEDLFDKIRENKIAIIAVENTLGGLVFDNKKIIENEFRILHKIDLKIDHCLLVNHGVKYKDIKKILLHPQVKRQTSDFLNDKSWEMEIIQSTSYGALKINQDRLTDTATIGSEKLAEYYDLSILKKGLSNELKNITTFWVVEK